MKAIYKIYSMRQLLEIIYCVFLSHIMTSLSTEISQFCTYKLLAQWRSTNS